MREAGSLRGRGFVFISGIFVHFAVGEEALFKLNLRDEKKEAKGVLRVGQQTAFEGTAGLLVDEYPAWWTTICCLFEMPMSLCFIYGLV